MESIKYPVLRHLNVKVCLKYHFSEVHFNINFKVECLKRVSVTQFNQMFEIIGKFLR